MNYKKSFLLGSLIVLLSAVGFVYPASAQVPIQPGCYYNNQNTGAPNFSTGPVAPIGSTANQACPAGATPYNANGTVATQGVNGNLSYIPLEPLSTSQGNVTNFCSLLNLFFRALIYLGGMLAVLFFWCWVALRT